MASAFLRISCGKDNARVIESAMFTKRKKKTSFVDLIRRMPRNGCYVDVGAAIGYYLILARKLAPDLEIHGVEPLERHWHLLRENLALNDLVADNFKIHPEALTSTEGTEIFMDRGYSSRLEPTGEKKNIS